MEKVYAYEEKLFANSKQPPSSDMVAKYWREIDEFRVDESRKAFKTVETFSREENRYPQFL